MPDITATSRPEQEIIEIVGIDTIRGIMTLPEQYHSEIAQSWANTLQWWYSEHTANSLYHHEFGRGYCPKCRWVES